ncbi:MAG: thiamine pyrophosphate-binding protein [Hyphomicrobiaceae bacterium]|nr:thiamine pyrophosphate-binding protein [Hyphomicrobiaceae bacterium]
MSATNTARLDAAESVIKVLIANGIDKLYCLPGVQNDDFFDALVRTGQAITPIHARHEQASGYMALGAAMATGRPQAYCVVPGPGFLNTTTALATAQSLYQPVLAISGQIFEDKIGKGLGYLHEIPDQLGIMRTLTKWAAHIDGAEDAGAKAREAFRQMLSGVPGPAGIECGWDVWKRAAEVAIADDPVRRETPAVDEDAAEAAARLLAGSKRPMIWVGGGALDAAAEVRQLAEMLEAPVVSFRTGAGVLDMRHPLAQRVTGAYKLWPEVDVLLGVGTRLHQQLEWGTDDKMKVIHLDIDPTRPGRIRTPDVKLVADAREGLAAIIARLGRHLGKRESRRDELARINAEVASELADLAPQKAWIDALRQGLPEDGILVEELTQVSYVSRVMLPVYAPRTYIASGYQGTLGWGYPTALGVKAAMPDRPVVSVSGDGGFMFGMQEIATATRHNIPLVAIVFNDNAYGNVRRMQQLNYDGRVVASDLKNPDFVKLGESFGIRSTRAQSPTDLTRQMGEALKAGEPALIEVPVGPFPDPWRLFFRKKARG